MRPFASNHFIVSLVLSVACNRPPVGEDARPASEAPVERFALVESVAAASATDVRLEVTGAPDGTTVLVRASDRRSPVVPTRPLSEATSLALQPGFFEIVLSTGSAEQVIQLYARPGASVGMRWGDPRSLVVQGGTPIDRTAAEKAWEADLEQLTAAVGEWDGTREPPAALREAIAAQRAAIVALGDGPYAHLLRLRHASYVAQLTGPKDAWSVVAPIAADSQGWAAYAPWLCELMWFLKDLPEASARFQEVRAGVADAGLQAAFVSMKLMTAERSGGADALAEKYAAATIVGGPLVVGEPMPRFELRGVEDGTTVRSEALLGVPYLIEVWSTWCEPCVEAMKDLHALHERVAAADPPRLRIISVAINDTRAPVEEFRRERWPMPWSNVWVPGGDLLFKSWSFAEVPYAVLVGADGRVIAAGPHISLDAVLGPQGEDR